MSASLRQVSTIFIITKTEIIQIKSWVQYDEQSQTIEKKKNIEKIYTIKHLDSLEIAGDDHTVLLITFKQN